MGQLNTELYSSVASFAKQKSPLKLNDRDHSLLITEDTVISVDDNGKPMSYFENDVWELSTSKSKTYLRFEMDADESAAHKQIVNDIKTLQYLSFYRPVKSSKRIKDGFDAQKTINNSLRAVSSLCIDEGLSVSQIFTGNYNHYLEDRALSHSDYAGLSYLLGLSSALEARNLATLINIAPVKRAFKGFVQKKIVELKPEHNQTLPIPERIYLKALELIELDLNGINSRTLTLALREIEKNIKNPSYGLEKTTQKTHFRETEEYKKILAENDWFRLPNGYDIFLPGDSNNPEIKTVYEKLGLDSENSSILDIREWISKVQIICFRALIAYTGARLSDIHYLKSNSLKIHKVGNKKYPVLYGEVQKGVNTDDDVEFWVTNKMGEKAFNLAQRISKFIYEHSMNSKFDVVPEDNRLLFASLKLSQNEDREHNPINLGTVFSSFCPEDIVISKDDLRELSLLAPALDLDREDVQEQIQWKFTAHQFRRTLALYSMASGAVSLPALRRQLRHLGEAITLFYSDGSCAASNILLVNKSFAKECNESKSASTAIALHKFVSSEERMFGGMGQHLHKNDYLNTIIVDQDRTELTRMIERGEVAYTETALGGCAESGPCEQRQFALTEVEPCLFCDKAMHSLTRINKSVQVIEVSLDSMIPNTRQYKWREKSIQNLKKTRDSYVAEMENYSDD